MRGSYPYEPEQVNHNSRAPSDPHGHHLRAGGRSHRNDDLVPQKKLMQVLSRTNPGRVDDNRRRTPSNPLDHLKYGQPQESLWDTLTESCQDGEDETFQMRDVSERPPRYHLKSASLEYDENIEPTIYQNDHVFNRYGSHSYPRTRRVQFAEKLEIDTKTPLEALRIPTRPILRKAGYTVSKNNNDSKCTDILEDLRNIQECNDRRDPTPSGVVRAGSFSLDPPTDGSESLLYSVSSSSPHAPPNASPAPERLTISERVDARNRMRSEVVRQEPPRRIELDSMCSPRIGDWDMTDIFLDRQSPQISTPAQTNLRRSGSPTLGRSLHVDDEDTITENDSRGMYSSSHERNVTRSRESDYFTPSNVNINVMDRQEPRRINRSIERSRAESILEKSFPPISSGNSIPIDERQTRRPLQKMDRHSKPPRPSVTAHQRTIPDDSHRPDHRNMVHSPSPQIRQYTNSNDHTTDQLRGNIPTRQNHGSHARANRPLPVQTSVRSSEPSHLPPTTVEVADAADADPWEAQVYTRNRTSTLCSERLRVRPPSVEVADLDPWVAPTSTRNPNSDSNSTLVPMADLADSWMLSPCRSDISTESQTAYLIRKYTGTSMSKSDERAKPTGKSIFNGNPSLERKQGMKRMAEPMNAVKRTGRTEGYSSLEDDESTFQGTELILLPKTTELQVHEGQERHLDYTDHDSHDRRPNYIAQFSEKSNATTLPYPNLPILAVSYDENDEKKTKKEPDEQRVDVQRSTSTTDEESESGNSGNYYNRSHWDVFDNSSNESGKENDNLQLLPKSGMSKTKRWRLCVLVAMILCSSVILGLAVYFRGKDDVLQEVELDSNSCLIAHRDDEIFSDRYYEIRNYLASVSLRDVSLVDIALSPQRESLCWIADSDERKVSINDNNVAALVQRYTLGVLYYALVGKEGRDPLNVKYSNFLSSEHECEWNVIMCNSSKKVTGLLLADKKLSGSLPAEIGNLIELTFLELNLNKLIGSIPSSVGELTKLEHFGVAFNALTGTLPTEMGTMERLELLNLRSSNIEGTIPSELGRLHRLETLLLEGNWLSGTIPIELGNLLRVEQMSFQRNYLSGRVSDEICELRDGNLEELEVDSWVECTCCTS